MDSEKLRKSVHYGFTLVTILMLLSGLGITEYRIMEKISFGVLGKATSFQVHNGLWLLFTVLLVAHIYLSFIKRKG
jgi:thiosulfate reductase cytochrome b subunit